MFGIPFSRDLQLITSPIIAHFSARWATDVLPSAPFATRVVFSCCGTANTLVSNACRSATHGERISEEVSRRPQGNQPSPLQTVMLHLVDTASSHTKAPPAPDTLPGLGQCPTLERLPAETTLTLRQQPAKSRPDSGRHYPMGVRQVTTGYCQTGCKAT